MGISKQTQLPLHPSIHHPSTHATSEEDLRPFRVCALDSALPSSLVQSIIYRPLFFCFFSSVRSFVRSLVRGGNNKRTSTSILIADNEFFPHYSLAYLCFSVSLFPANLFILHLFSFSALVSRILCLSFCLLRLHSRRELSSAAAVVVVVVVVGVGFGVTLIQCQLSVRVSLFRLRAARE